MQYNFNKIEAKWQKYWSDNQTFKASNSFDKPKYYVLDMFPYPSGAGLHVGHPLGYIASDIYARYKRHQGFNVLHPQGYDSFGLPAEQYAIQTGQHPALTTQTNVARYREQLDKIGFSFDWSREVRTSSADYYKWTQWIFIQLFNSWYNNDTNKAEDIATLTSIFEVSGNDTVNAVCDEDIKLFTAKDWQSFSDKEKQQILLQYRLTFLAETEVNWCPALGTVLANDEIVNGVSERGGHEVVRKKMTQWSMRISAYAERLLNGIDYNQDCLDWTDSIKEIQRNWIGKSVGASVVFNVKEHDATIEVFTTRPDTIFGVSFMTLAPEHELVSQLVTADQKDAVAAYIESTAKRSERERMADVKTISGVFTGAYAEHPFTKEPIPVWIGDYVLASYGTGAVMAVPSGDQRDYDFAKHFDIAIPNVFEGVDITEAAHTDKSVTIANSDFLNGLKAKKAAKLAIYKLEELGQGKGKTQYRLRDAVFSRQRYWGEPFPVYYKGGMPQMIAEKHLPIELPEVAKYLPTETGEPPLGNATHWTWCTTKNEVVANTEKDGCMHPLELNTMPGWAGSSWYLFRYMDAQNNEVFASKENLDYWQNVDLYIGGSEHATGHLLYARFWTKFLHDRGFINVDEPFKKMINQGMILGTSAFVYRIDGTNKFVSKGLTQDHKVIPLHVDVSLVNASDELDIEGFRVHPLNQDYKDAEFVLEDGAYKVGREVEKMSKSKYNVVNPDEICERYGADTLRLYEMFLGPLEQAKPWNTAGITGVHNFLKKLWKLYVDDNGVKVTTSVATKDNFKTLHKTIKKVAEDIENFSFNTSVSTFMICVNELTAQKCTAREILEPLAVLISPYAPHIAEELWEQLGNTISVSEVAFPIFDKKHLVESSKNYPVSFNGKMRFMLELPLDMSKDAIEENVLADERTVKQLDGRAPNKIIIVPGKIINLVG
ncbi:leucine--tRNA ligase [Flavobacteriaceae bacterium]|nr:leucine--tRNA ligase [Flavobacteriaceae bacterium]